jgi:hypothetical protein
MKTDGKDQKTRAVVEAQSRALYQAGLANYANGQFEEARAAWNSSLKLDPTNMDTKHALDHQPR